MQVLDPAETWRILVVEGDPAWRQTLSAALQTRGYEVVGVSNGQEGVAQARLKPFHVAVVDGELPDLDGIQTIRDLKGIHPDIEVIFAAASQTTALAREAIRLGAYACLIKPFDIVEIEALLPSMGEKISLKSLVALYDTTRSLFADVKLAELLRNLVGQAVRVLAADDVSVMLLSDKQTLKIAASTSIPPNKWESIEVPLTGVAGRVAQWRAGVMINGPLSSDPRFADLPSRPEVRYSLVHPLLLHDDLIGILSANRKASRPHFVAQDLRHAAIFCSIISQAIENAKLYDQLRRLDELKDEFIATVSHDLRSPLDAITMVTEGLTDGTYGPLSDQQKRLLNLIKDSTRNLGSFVNNILDVAKIKAGKMEYAFVTVKPQELVLRLTELFSLRAKTKGITMEHAIQPDLAPIQADPEKLEQVLNNLIGNAMKFTPSGGRIRVEINDDADGMRFSVTDTGIGIAPDKAAKLFQKFYQVDLERQRELNIVGTGLGLSICKTIVEGHQGRIWIESELGRGATFRFVIPKAGAEAPAAA